MSPHYKSTLFTCLVAFSMAIGNSQAATMLTLTDGDGDSTQTQVAVGQSFTVTVTLQSNSEQTTGLTYFLEETAIDNPHFQITGRDITGSTYSELTESTTVILTEVSALLDSMNDSDLGAGLENLNSPNGVGFFFVANITMTVLPNTPQGVYTLAFSSNSIVSGPGPDFAEITPTTSSYTINVVPEPGPVLLVSVGGLLLSVGARRRSGCVH